MLDHCQLKWASQSQTLIHIHSHACRIELARQQRTGLPYDFTPPPPPYACHGRYKGPGGPRSTSPTRLDQSPVVRGPKCHDTAYIESPIEVPTIRTVLSHVLTYASTDTLMTTSKRRKLHVVHGSFCYSRLHHEFTCHLLFYFRAFQGLIQGRTSVTLRE